MKRRNSTPGWDPDVTWLAWGGSFIVDLALAASLALAAHAVDLGLIVALALGLGTYVASIAVLRGITGRSVGDWAAGLLYVRASTGGRPGIWRCAANEALMLLELPGPWWALEFFAGAFSENIADLRVKRAR